MNLHLCLEKIKNTPWPMLCQILAHRLGQSIRLKFWSSYYVVLFACCGCPCGRGLRVDGYLWVSMRQRGAISLGRRVTLTSRFGTNLVGLTNPTVLDCQRSGHIVIGDDSGCSGAILSSRTSIRIGRHVKIGGNVRIFDHDFHALDYECRRSAEDSRQVHSRPVTIGDDVFIGTNSIIMKGVMIGDRSIVGAGSVVTKTIPPDEIWAGNPARCVKILKNGIMM